MGRKSLGQFFLLAAVLLLSISSWQVWSHRNAQIRVHDDDFEHGSSSQPTCRTLPGAEDVVVALKTGATELLDKLPVHLETTTRCYPHYVVYSDHGETHIGQLVVDALKSVSENVREQNPDFEIYRRMNQYGRAALADGAFDGGSTEVNVLGNRENPGWKLDKWKFLPMVNQTYFDFPDVKWYVFAEADTYIVWSSLLKYLLKQDPFKPSYTGMYMQIGQDAFAYGGAGYVISSAAMKAFSAHYAKHKTELENSVDEHWAGDCILGKALSDTGVSLTGMWPFIQSDYPGWLTYSVQEHPSMTAAIAEMWCHPVATFHHVSPDSVRGMWEVEQEWIKTTRSSTDGYLRQHDVYERFVWPRMLASDGVDWDNGSEVGDTSANSLDECRRVCERHEDCLQYSFSEESGSCKISDYPRLGLARIGIRSGWYLERIETWAQGMPDCKSARW